MLPWSAGLAGPLTEHVITSQLLRANPLGDPHERPLLVYTPPGYEVEPQRRYPAVFVLQGFTGHVAMWHNRSAFRQPFTVRRLGRYRALPLISVRRGGAVRRRALSHGRDP